MIVDWRAALARVKVKVRVKVADEDSEDAKWELRSIFCLFAEARIGGTISRDPADAGRWRVKAPCMPSCSSRDGRCSRGARAGEARRLAKLRRRSFAPSLPSWGSNRVGLDL
jgi:hypothetical protein